MQTKRTPRARLGVALVLTALGALFAGCTEVESAAVDGYQPSHIEHIEGTDLVRVEFTKEGAERTGLETAEVTDEGGRLVVPYASLIYGATGETYVYTSPKPLEFIREEVVVDRIEGDRVFLTEGPPAGTDVVTVGAIEVYGAELEIAGSH